MFFINLPNMRSDSYLSWNLSELQRSFNLPAAADGGHTDVLETLYHIKPIQRSFRQKAELFIYPHHIFVVKPWILNAP